jgi:hypothetical protein
VALVRTDFSKEPIASFIRVTKIGELGATLAVTINRRTLRSLKLSGHDPGHLVTQFRIYSEFTNNPTLPFYRSLGPLFVSGHLRPMLLSLPPYSSLWILHSEFHSSFLSHLLFRRSVRRLLVTASVPIWPILVSLMKEALSISETLALTRATRRNIAEDTILHSHRRENINLTQFRTTFGDVCYGIFYFFPWRISIP